MAKTDVTRFALLHDLFQRRECFGQRRFRIRRVRIKNVDVIKPEALQ